MEFLPGSHTTVYPTTDTYAPDNLLTRGQVIDWDTAATAPPAAAAAAGTSGSGGGGGEILYDVLHPGEYSVNHLGIAHGGGPNEGSDRRIGFNVTYITPDVRSVREEGAFAQLIRGVDDYGHFTHDLHPT